jgi:hypothetical protein
MECLIRLLAANRDIKIQKREILEGEEDRFPAMVLWFVRDSGPLTSVYGTAFNAVLVRLISEIRECVHAEKRPAPSVRRCIVNGNVSRY